MAAQEEWRVVNNLGYDVNVRIENTDKEAYGRVRYMDYTYPKRAPHRVEHWIELTPELAAMRENVAAAIRVLKLYWCEEKDPEEALSEIRDALLARTATPKPDTTESKPYVVRVRDCCVNIVGPFETQNDAAIWANGDAEKCNDCRWIPTWLTGPVDVAFVAPERIVAHVQKDGV